MPRRGHSEIVWQPCHEADYARPDQSQVLTFPSLQPQKTFATMCPSLLPDPGFCCGEIFDEKMRQLIAKKRKKSWGMNNICQTKTQLP
jgi:hypothetical protein